MPSWKGSPAEWAERSFSTNGTPRNGPSGRSADAAWARARSKSGVITALSCGFTRSMRSMAASTSSAGLASPERTSVGLGGGVEVAEVVGHGPSVGGRGGPLIMPRARRARRRRPPRCTPAVSSRARSSPKRSTRRHGLDPVAHAVEHLPGDGHAPARRAAPASAATPPTTLPSKLCSSRKPSPVMTRSAPSSRSSSSQLVGHQLEAAHQPAPRPRPARRPGPRRRRRPRGRARRRRARRGTPGPGARGGGAAARPGPGWRPSAGRTTVGRVEEAARGRRRPRPARSPLSRPSGCSARSARQPAVGGGRAAEARRSPAGAPVSTAATISSPVPIGRRPPPGRCPPRRRRASRPEPAAISITAVRPSSRHAASTGSPSGPVTVVVRLGPPSASRVPSPPSAIGTSSHVPAGGGRGAARSRPPPRPRSRCPGTCRGRPPRA